MRAYVSGGLAISERRRYLYQADGCIIITSPFLGPLHSITLFNHLYAFSSVVLPACLSAEEGVISWSSRSSLRRIRGEQAYTNIKVKCPPLLCPTVSCVSICSSTAIFLIVTSIIWPFSIGGHTDMPVETDDEDDPFLSLPPPTTIPVQSMLTNYQTINVLAPLVRCSKLPFRHLCSLYETHVTHTPMVLAEEFSRSQAARISDFTTSRDERGVFWMEPRGSSSSGYSNGHSEDREGVTFHKPGSTSRLPPTPEPPTKHSELVRGALIAQFASPNATSLADAAELIAPYVDGVDLNCGCPQRWAYNEGIGCALLRKPELVREMVRAVKGRLGWDWPVSIKIRVDPDLK